jgi:hypothetical protein
MFENIILCLRSYFQISTTSSFLFGSNFFWDCCNKMILIKKPADLQPAFCKI